mmetsp:Transcript_3387/g.5901  ORF Transcript_3387/g.5901 Transcript_3387/m.5901 type:complete len:262 (-) Transcript_3387:118-903(-)
MEDEVVASCTVPLGSVVDAFEDLSGCRDRSHGRVEEAVGGELAWRKLRLASNGHHSPLLTGPSGSMLVCGGHAPAIKVGLKLVVCPSVHDLKKRTALQQNKAGEEGAAAAASTEKEENDEALPSQLDKSAASGATENGEEQQEPEQERTPAVAGVGDGEAAAAEEAAELPSKSNEKGDVSMDIPLHENFDGDNKRSVDNIHGGGGGGGVGSDGTFANDNRASNNRNDSSAVVFVNPMAQARAGSLKAGLSPLLPTPPPPSN